MKIEIKSIGTVHTREKNIPRHWTMSDVEGTLVIDENYLAGLRDIHADERIVVLFYFHKSPDFTSNHLCQTPPHEQKAKGVFSICSPVRPNPIGMSILQVVAVQGNVLQVRGLDMLDGTPVLDIKPWWEREGDDPGKRKN
ncbi:MAG: tRNA (N6-threonylcarbamoyladenosine(37)-N6)-methyltransferase TrmO [Pseudomonadota bacterium]|nr:tRNA (N6-threonylcarbamoyladenosine(37)-N6)-methyltransferase TrmO [Pseudomonadota bacterium]